MGKLSGTYHNTCLRTPQYVSATSQMCSTCSEQCNGLCELGLSAIRGKEAVYPYGTTNQQFASEKKYPFTFEDFNINGRVFGAVGAKADSESTNVYSVNLDCQIGEEHVIKLKTPILLPAIAKLNWHDYYAGAAVAGTIATIGESAVKNDKNLEYTEDGKVKKSPLLHEMIESFRQYEHGYGDIVLQVNADDIAIGVAEYALSECGIKTVEIKFGQAAKGIQHVAFLNSYEEALSLKKQGYLVEPDPLLSEIKEKVAASIPLQFIQYGRLPMWDEDSFKQYVNHLRTLGATNIFIKMAGYDMSDIQRVIELASENHVSLITFDGAGGGTGHSPCTMMNEWSYPTIELEKIVVKKLIAMKANRRYIPKISIAGGFSLEDDIFKALALGGPFINFVSVGRAPMAAAMRAQAIEEQINNTLINDSVKRFGDCEEDIFRNYRYMKQMYPEISSGTIGVYSYLERISFGLKLFMTLNRKFSLEYLNYTDVIPLTSLAKEYLYDITKKENIYE